MKSIVSDRADHHTTVDYADIKSDIPDDENHHDPGNGNMICRIMQLFYRFW